MLFLYQKHIGHFKHVSRIICWSPIVNFGTLKDQKGVIPDTRFGEHKEISHTPSHST